MREEGEEERKQDKVSPLENFQGETLKDKTSREEILKEIEKEHSEENSVPEIMRGSVNPFEEKMKEGVLLAPVEEKHYMEENPETALLPEPEKAKNKYADIDPYKEPIE